MDSFFLWHGDAQLLLPLFAMEPRGPSHLCTLGHCLSRCHWLSSAGWAGLRHSSLPDTHRRWSWRKPGHHWTWLGHCLESQGSHKRSLGSQKSTLFTRTKAGVTWGTEMCPQWKPCAISGPCGLKCLSPCFHVWSSHPQKGGRERPVWTFFVISKT